MGWGRRLGVWSMVVGVVLGLCLSGLCSCQSYVNEVPYWDGGQDGGGDPEPLNVCDEVSQLVAGWMNERCQDWRGCCFCECWLDGQRVVDSFDPCVCGGSSSDPQPLPRPTPQPTPQPAPGAPCEGEQKNAAELCLQDQQACWEGMVEAVDSLCSLD